MTSPNPAVNRCLVCGLRMVTGAQGRVCVLCETIFERRVSGADAWTYWRLHTDAMAQAARMTEGGACACWPYPEEEDAGAWIARLRQRYEFVIDRADEAEPLPVAAPKIRKDKREATPAPWHERGPLSVQGPDGSGPGGKGRRTICMMLAADDPQTQADKRLILRAPALRDACFAARDILQARGKRLEGAEADLYFDLIDLLDNLERGDR